MNSVLRSVIFAALMLVAGVQAQAGTLLLDYKGVTSTNSDAGPGVEFEVQATFSTDNPVAFDTGISEYLATSVTLLINNTSYAADLTLVPYVVLLADDSNTNINGSFTAALLAGGYYGFIPIYTGATTPGWDAQAPTPTGFTGYTYVGSTTQSVLPMIIADDSVLAVDFDPAVGLTTTLTAAVPEPSSLGMTGLAVMGGLGVWTRRRRVSVAV